MESLNFEQFKADVHRTLISKLDLEKLSTVQPARARQAVANLVNEIVVENKMPLNSVEKERIQSDLLDEVFGLGPLEALLRDPKVSDILVNNKNLVYVERGGILQKTDVVFRDDRHIMQIIDRIVSKVGRRVDESSPMVDARLPDGSRVNAIIPPLALDGPALSIRRFGTGPLTADALVDLKSASPEMLQILSAAVKARISILISGGTGAGKTTFLNMLSQYIPPTERLITIEDAAELQLAQENVVRLETRPPNVEGEVTFGGPQAAIGLLQDDGSIAPVRDRRFKSGDLATIDEDGFVRITGRTKDLIIRGGMNISPVEVDAVLLAHPALADAACLGVPDPIYGEEIVAFGVLRGGGKSDEIAILNYCAERLPVPKRPKEFFFISELPKSDRGKVLRDRLREEWLRHKRG